MSNSRQRKPRQIKRVAGGVLFFLLGGTTAAALSIAREPQHAQAAAVPARVSAEPSDRIALPESTVRAALAAGTIDRPIKTILNVPGRMSYGDFRWDDKGVPAGPTWIRVDLKSQLLSVFRGGHEIGTAVILYGAGGVPTPMGRFPVLAKLKDHRSATYDAPMPYTLRLTSDGVSIHASSVRWGYATHGCIGVPEAFAAKLFAAASIGDEVLITNG
ncbi:MAG: L,D-transpeptidase family protein [Sphingomicrobium sp.]